MFLLLDNFDSFTYNLADYLAQCGADFRVVRNNVSLSKITRGDYRGIILSPGPGTPQSAGGLMQVVGHYADRLPILGICLGHQALGQHFGAKLERAAQPMHGKLSYIDCEADAVFAGLPARLSVVRYHSLVLTHLPDTLEVTARTDAGEIMAFRHKNLPVYGVQFHPEAALTQDGLKMMGNWLNFALEH